MKKLFPNLNANSTMWDLLNIAETFNQKMIQDRSYYKDFRKTIGDENFRIRSGYWNYDEVTKNIGKFLKESGANLTFLEYIETSFKNKKEPIGIHEFYTTAYLVLDIIGFKADGLPKRTDNMLNIHADAEHSFYGAHCDFLVADDKKLRLKSKVLYHELSVSTKIIKPIELISELNNAIDSIDKKKSLVEQVFSFCTDDNLVESYPINENNVYESSVHKLPKFYFNYFNYVVKHYDKEKKIFAFIFKKVFDNFSRYSYFTESEMLIDFLTDYFGYEDKEELEIRKKAFVYDGNETSFDWISNSLIIKLIKDKKTNLPELNYVFFTENEEEG